MPKKKPAVKLPQVDGASPRSLDGTLDQVGAGDLKQRRVLWDPSTLPDDEASTCQEPSEVSTALPASISREDARNISEALERAVQVPSTFAAGVVGLTGDWEVQSPEEIIHEVQKRVQERTPWSGSFDDSAMEKRRETERKTRLDHACHILLPDNRVRAMEEQLSRRVRAQLLDEEEPPEPAPQPTHHRTPRGQKKETGKPKKKVVRNPWYLPAKTWYDPKANMDTSEGAGGGFPYDSQSRPEPAREEEEDAGAGSDDKPRYLTRKDKESLQSVQAFVSFMKGQRLPYFLQ